RRPRRQQVGIQELLLEVVAAARRRVDDVAALVDAHRLPVGVEADDRATVVDRGTIPVLDVAQEVVCAAVGAEVLVGGGFVRRRPREVQALTGDDGQPVPGGDGRACVGGGDAGGAGGVRVPEAPDVVPGVREERHRVRDDRRGDVVVGVRVLGLVLVFL